MSHIYFLIDYQLLSIVLIFWKNFYLFFEEKYYLWKNYVLGYIYIYIYRINQNH